MQTIKILKKTLGIVSTGGPLPIDREELGLRTIQSLGYSHFQTLASSKFYADYTYGFANGSPEMRNNAISDCLENVEVDCIIAGRGASGSLEIISMVDFSKWAASRKTLIGDSDVTSFLVHLAFNHQLPTIHGSTLGASFADYNNKSEAKISIESLIKMLADPSYRQEYQFKTSINFRNETEGQLICGNLTMLCALLGTKYDVDYSDKILVLEEVAEAPYRIQRMLLQLFHAGKFEKLKGLCFGRFAKCESAHGPTVEQVIRNFFTDRKLFNFPIGLGLEIGHWGTNLPVPIGCMGRMQEKSLIQLESPLEIKN